MNTNEKIQMRTRIFGLITGVLFLCLITFAITKSRNLVVTDIKLLKIDDNKTQVVVKGDKFKNKNGLHYCVNLEEEVLECEWQEEEKFTKEKGIYYAFLQSASGAVSNSYRFEIE